MKNLNALIQKVETARRSFIETIQYLSHTQASFKPASDKWSILENAEHIVWAEQIGVNRMWQAIDGTKNGQPVWEGTPVHAGRSIEEVIALTWKPKEQVPEVAKPRWGGPLHYWVAALKACAPVLETLASQLEGCDPEQIIYPHPISGPLDVRQRLEFLRFHLNRHQGQIESIKAHPLFPNK